MACDFPPIILRLSLYFYFSVVLDIFLGEASQEVNQTIGPSSQKMIS